MNSPGVQLSFDFYMIEAKPENLIGDRSYYRRNWIMNSCKLVLK
jgi:hypothetical protein